jgi:hypothetical protein
VGDLDAEGQPVSASATTKIKEVPMSRTASQPFSPLDPVGIDANLSLDERDVRDTVRRFCDDRIETRIADWFEAGTIPDICERPSNSERLVSSACIWRVAVPRHERD